MLRLRVSILAGIPALIALASVLPAPGPVLLSPGACTTDWDCELRFGPEPLVVAESDLPLAAVE